MIRWFLKLASTRPGGWFFVRVTPPLDRFLLRLSRGRFSMAITAPILLLTTTGARSGQPRSTPLLYRPDGERFVLIASKGGDPRHPAWYHNLRAKPEASVAYGSESVEVAARPATEAESDRAFEAGAAFYGGFPEYRERASHREIEVFVLEPRQP